MDRIPIINKKQTRNCKLTKEQSREKQISIIQDLKRHIGQPAIFITKDGRETTSYFIQIVSIGSKIAARYKCYAPDGKFRCFMIRNINYASLLTGEQQVIYFGDI